LKSLTLSKKNLIGNYYFIFKRFPRVFEGKHGRIDNDILMRNAQLGTDRVTGLRSLQVNFIFGQNCRAYRQNRWYNKGTSGSDDRFYGIWASRFFGVYERGLFLL